MTSAVVDAQELSNFTTLPIGKKTLLPGIARQIHVIDSCDIRRHPSRKFRDFAKPTGDTNPNKGFRSSQRKTTTDKSLEKKRQTLVDTVQATLAKWRHLERDEKKLQRCFIQFSKFLKESTEKRERFLSNTSNLQEHNRLRTAEIEYLRLELEKCKIIKRLLNIEFSKHSIYGAYLEKVVQESRFKTVQDMLGSFEVTFDSLERTTRNYHHAFKEFEGKGKALEIIVFTKAPLVLDLHLKSTCLSKRHDDICRKNVENENIILGLCSRINEAKVVYDDCLLSIDTLYGHLCRRLNIKRKYAKKDYKNQLIFIKTALGSNSN